MNYEAYMKVALAEAQKGVMLGEQPYGAVLVSNGEIVAKAHNEVMSTKNSKNHAEIVALNDYQNNYQDIPNDLTLVTTCEPCPKCLATAIKLGIRNFVFGSSIETAINFNSGDLDISINDFKELYDLNITGNILQDECNHLLEDFYCRQNIVTYSSGTKEDIYWMQRALEVGRKGMLEKKELPIGVLLVAGNELLTESSTMTYTLNSPITHGDFMALYNAEREVYSPDCKRPLVLYSTLEPHLIGFAAAIKCKVDKVVFGLEAIPDGGSCYFPHMYGVKERLPMVVGGVLRDEQYKLMKEFLDTHEENRVGYSYAKSLVKLYEEGKKR